MTSASRIKEVRGRWAGKSIPVQHDDEGCLQTTAGKVEGRKMGVRMRTGDGQQEEYRVGHMIFADNCYLCAASKEKIRKMIADTTEELRKGGVHWKEDQMEVMAWEFEGKMEMFFWRLTAESTELGRLKPFIPWRL